AGLKPLALHRQRLRAKVRHIKAGICRSAEALLPRMNAGASTKAARLRLKMPRAKALFHFRAVSPAKCGGFHRILPPNTPLNTTDESTRSDPARAIILKSDCNAGHRGHGPASHGFSPSLYSMACHWRGASLVGCCADPCGRPVDQSADNRGTHRAPSTG